MDGGVTNNFATPNSTKKKRPILLFLAVIFILLLAALLFFITKKDKHKSEAFSNIISIADLPKDSTRFVSSFQNNYYAYDLSSSSLIRFKNKDQVDSLLQIDFVPEGQKILNVKWSPDHTKAYILTGKNKLEHIFFADLAEKKIKELDSHILDIAFFQNQSIYLFNSQGSTSLNSSNFDGTSWRQLTSLPNYYSSLALAKNEKSLLIWGLGTEGEKSLATYDLSSNKLSEVDTGLIEMAAFSPDSSKILYSKAKDGQSQLYLFNKEIVDLKTKIYPTMATWLDNDNIIFGTYEVESDGVVMTRFYKEDINARVANEVNQSKGDQDNLEWLSSEGNQVFFISNNKLKQFSL